MDNADLHSDTVLLEAFRSATPPDWAVRQLYRDGFRMCSSYILKNGGNQQDAEDSFQNVVVGFIEMVQEGRFRAESSITSLLYSMTRHQWLNELRRRGRALTREAAYEQVSMAGEGSPDAGAGLELSELKAEVLRLIGRLGTKCRDILVAFYYEGLPMRDILTRTGYQSEQVLRNKKTKCMKTLVETLAAREHLAPYLRSILQYE